MGEILNPERHANSFYRWLSWSLIFQYVFGLEFIGLILLVVSIYHLHLYYSERYDYVNKAKVWIADFRRQNGL